MAGGGGTRLWPLSSPERPKPFLPLLGDRTLLQLSADRLEGVVEPESVFVVTDRRYVGHVAAQLPAATILTEPEGRNTAAAIAYATVAIDRPDDEVMLVLPADQTVRLVEEFGTSIRAAGTAAEGAMGVSRPIVTLGITPTYPATVFGYVVPEGPAELVPASPGVTRRVYAVVRFTEKPDLAAATALYEDHVASWNAGIFVWRRSTIRTAFERDAPDILDAVTDGIRGDLAGAYGRVRATSIDYAVLEPASAAGDVLVVPADVGWNDLGSWSSLLGELGMPGIEATIAKPGEPFAAGDDDLVIWRPSPQRLVSRAGADATMTGSNGPVAILRDARAVQARIDALLDRCSSPEAHP